MEKNFWGPKKCFFAILSQSHIRTPDPDRIAEKYFLGPQKFFSTILSPSHIRTPGPTKADKTFWGPQSFFPRSCPRHIFEPLVPQKPTKLSGAPKVFSTILSLSHIRTPGPTKADKTFRGPKSSSSHAHTGTNTHLPTRPPDLDNFLFQP